MQSAAAQSAQVLPFDQTKSEPFTQFQNRILDHLITFRIPGTERQVFDYILRNTYGWHVPSIPYHLSDIAAATGMKRQNAHKCLKSLIRKNILILSMGRLLINPNVQAWQSKAPRAMVKPVIKKHDKKRENRNQKGLLKLLASFNRKKGSSKKNRQRSFFSYSFKGDPCQGETFDKGASDSKVEQETARNTANGKTETGKIEQPVKGENLGRESRLPETVPDQDKSGAIKAPVKAAADRDKSGQMTMSAGATEFMKTAAGQKQSKKVKGGTEQANEAINRFCNELEGYDTGRFNPQQFAQKAIRDKKHPGAVADTLKILLDRYKIGGPPADCWSFVESILRIKSQNYHEAEGMREAQKREEDLAEAAKMFFGGDDE